MNSPLLGKDLLGLEELTSAQIQLLLDTAEPFKEISLRAIKKVPTLRGATIVNLFFEPSTRTRISFEFAEKRLSAEEITTLSELIGGFTSSHIVGRDLLSEDEAHPFEQYPELAIEKQWYTAVLAEIDAIRASQAAWRAEDGE